MQWDFGLGRVQLDVQGLSLHLPRINSPMRGLCALHPLEIGTCCGPPRGKVMRKLRK